jgi:hypothetical protein
MQSTTSRVLWVLCIVDQHIRNTLGREPDQKFIFSDGCSGQYKSKGPFADLSLETGVVNRNYFGSEHGKSECDADIGVLNRLVERAITGNKVIINNAEDLFTFCEANLKLNEILSKRNFFLVRTQARLIESDLRPMPKLSRSPGNFTRRATPFNHLMNFR